MMPPINPTLPMHMFRAALIYSGNLHLAPRFPSPSFRSRNLTSYNTIPIAIASICQA